MSKQSHLSTFFIALTILIFLGGCKPDLPLPIEAAITEEGWVYNPTPYIIEKPLGLPPLPPPPIDNPTTIAGVKLGRHLFYDPVLSADSTLSCSGCHHVDFAFTDSGNRFSDGITGIQGHRNSMPLFNLAYMPLSNETGFFWDGRAPTLEDQALIPIADPNELNEVLPNILKKLKANDFYRQLFFEAFGTTQITEDLVGKAIAQFERTIVSGTSKFDSVLHVPLTFFTDEENLGFELFQDLNGGDCFHCHTAGGQFTDFIFRNNGLDSVTSYTQFMDPGRGFVTGDTIDYGKFKTPSLRNVVLTAPYMHDGRFATLEEVLEHYNEHVKDTPYTDQFMQFAFQGGLHLSEDSIQAIIAFLKTLTDHTLATNPAYQNPFEE